MSGFYVSMPGLTVDLTLTGSVPAYEDGSRGTQLLPHSPPSYTSGWPTSYAIVALDEDAQGDAQPLYGIT